MKLIPKIYFAFGSILLVFSFVTFTYVQQSDRVEKNTNMALASTEALRIAEGMEKAIIDAETGVRGFQVSDNETFLEPYFQGVRTYEEKRAALLTLVKNREQLKLLQAIHQDFGKWRSTFAEPSIKLQQKALQSPLEEAPFQDFIKNVVRKGVGKKITDRIRQHFIAFDREELRLREIQLSNLNNAINATRNLSIALTALSIIIGIVVVYLLAKTIRERLTEMANLANEVALGHFDVALQDNRNDEISKVSDSLNIMAKRLNDSFTSLQKTNNELDQFAYVVSHDLKAPLRAINNLAEWIEEDLPDVEPDVQRNLELMRGRVLRMENLINGILEYARIGRKKLPQTTFSTSQLVSEIIDSLSPAPNVQIKVSHDLPEVTSERILLQQVFSNLISNAIKYNDKPNPEVRISASPVPAGYEFRVSDNGPGIPEEYHQKVFGIFQTMEARDTRESTGIGLAIVKKIIDEKGGSIQILSKANEGSTFVFTWPELALTAPEHEKLQTAIVAK